MRRPPPAPAPAPDSAADGASSASRSQLSGLPRSSSSAPSSGAAAAAGTLAPALGAAAARGAGREPSRSSIASRAASCARGAARSRAARSSADGRLVELPVALAAWGRPRPRSPSRPRRPAPPGPRSGRAPAAPRASSASCAARSARAELRARARRLDEEGVLAARAAHANAARRNLGVVELKLRRALLAGDDQRAPPAAPARTPVLGSRRLSAVNDVSEPPTLRLRPGGASAGAPCARRARDTAAPCLAARAPARDRDRQGRHREDDRGRRPGGRGGRRAAGACCWPRSGATSRSRRCSRPAAPPPATPAARSIPASRRCGSIPSRRSASTWRCSSACARPSRSCCATGPSAS